VNHEVKNRLTEEAKKFGDIGYYGLGIMAGYKNFRNSIAHKKKWNPEVKNRGQHKEALERIEVTIIINVNFNIKKLQTLRSLLEKCVNNLYTII
jgi:hypothetical protein